MSQNEQQPPGSPYLPRLGAWQFIPNIGVIVPQELHGTGEHSVWGYQVYKEVIDRYRDEYMEFARGRLGVEDPTDTTAVVSAVEAFMRRLDDALAATVVRGATASQLTEDAARLRDASAQRDGFRLTEAAAAEILRKAPPKNLIVKLGCRNVRGLLERMAATDALAIGAHTDPAPHADVVLDVVGRWARADWFEDAPVQVRVVEPELCRTDESGDEAVAIARLAGRVVLTPDVDGAGRFPHTAFVLGVIRGIASCEIFADVYRRLSADADGFGAGVARSVRGHWGRFVASAHHLFENRVDREVPLRLRCVADTLGAGAAADAKELLRAAAGVYHLCVTLPDASFVPMSPWTWAVYRRHGGDGTPTPLMSATERDWTTMDFFSGYLERAGLGGRDAIDAKTSELVAEGKQADDVRAHFFPETIDPDDLLIRQTPPHTPAPAGRLSRPIDKPLLAPTTNAWESRYVLNAGVIRLEGTIYILYRAFGDDETSRVGLAWTKDGIHIDGRLDEPIFSPADAAESAGCEDVRTVRIGDRIYMLYTAWDRQVAQIAMASIDVQAFLERRFDAWERHGLAFPGLANKDAVLYPERIGGKWVAYHRIDPNMWVSYLDELTCPWPRTGAKIFASPCTGMMWDGVKIGAGGPPIRTTHGWLNIYHGVDYERAYRLGVFFMPLDDPARVVYRSPNPILEPETPWEVGGEGSWVPRVVFTCGAVPAEDKEVIGPDDEILVYYGAADTVIGVAKGRLRDIVPVLDEL